MLLWGETSSGAARVRINYYAKNGDLFRVRRGIYVKDKNYNKLELATKIFSPCYIGFETVLGQNGVTFQHYSQIFIAATATREIAIDGQIFNFKRIKDAVLTNQAGVGNKEGYAIASLERAFLDIVYVNNEYHFDNLSVLRWDKVYEILPIYGGNKRMAGAIKKYFNQVKAEAQ